MKEKERQIISHLRKDARASLASISFDIKMPISTIHDKINRLHKNKVIKKYTALINYSALGYHHHVKIALQVPHSQKKSLQEFLTNHSAINSIHEINNNYDFMIETVHRDIKEYLDFIETLNDSFEITEKQEFLIVNEISREKFV